MANKVLDINSKYGGKASSANFKNYEFAIDKYRPLRTPKLNVKKLFAPNAVNKLPEYIINKYNLSGLEFGNWVNQVRRLDYCLGTIVSFYDLQTILKFKNDNIGLNKTIGMAYGARGSSMAYAHYEPSSGIINLSRDRRIDKLAKNPLLSLPRYDETSQENWDKINNINRENNSGYGSIAHEYGHALDYRCAEYFTKNRLVALSGGRVTIFSYSQPERAYNHYMSAVTSGKSNLNELEQSFINCFTPLLFVNKKPTGYYRKVYDVAKKSEYWGYLNEIWARTFETYIAYKLFKKGVKNLYLVRDGKGKYRDELKKNFSRVYPTFGEIARVEKKIDIFIETINKNL